MFYFFLSFNLRTLPVSLNATMYSVCVCVCECALCIFITTYNFQTSSVCRQVENLKLRWHKVFATPTDNIEQSVCYMQTSVTNTNLIKLQRIFVMVMSLNNRDVRLFTHLGQCQPHWRETKYKCTNIRAHIE